VSSNLTAPTIFLQPFLNKSFGFFSK
jgi:hypothetical protein